MLTCALTWWPCCTHMMAMLHSHDGHVALTWWSCCTHMVAMLHSHDGHVAPQRTLFASLLKPNIPCLRACHYARANASQTSCPNRIFFFYKSSNKKLKTNVSGGHDLHRLVCWHGASAQDSWQQACVWKCWSPCTAWTRGQGTIERHLFLCLSMCVCVCVCVCVTHMYICTCVYVCACIAHMCIHVCVSVCVCVCMYLHACMHLVVIHVTSSTAHAKQLF